MITIQIPEWAVLVGLGMLLVTQALKIYVLTLQYKRARDAIAKAKGMKPDA